MKIVYVSGAITSPTIKGYNWNIAMGREAARQLWLMGFGVICPHMNTDFGFDYNSLIPHGRFLECDLRLIKSCADVLYMLPNWPFSLGARAEHDFAKLNNIPIVYSLEELKDWAKEEARKNALH